MGLADQLAELSQLHAEGVLSDDELLRAKERLLAAPPHDDRGRGSSAELDELRSYASATYRAVTQARRRQAVLAIVVAVLFALLTVYALAERAATAAQVAAVPDAPLVQALGVEIPDPRPAIARAQLQARAFAFAGLALVSGTVTVVALVVWLVVRPPPVQPPGTSGLA